MSEQRLLRVDNIPAYQNKMFPTQAEAIACPRGDVELSQNLATGMVRNIAFDADKLIYDGSYQNEQGYSPMFRAHVDAVADIIGSAFSGLRMLEIGCGKGTFLEQLRAAGHEAIGVDPAYEGDADYIIGAPFSAGLGVRGDAIVMRHVLEHLADPAAFLQQVRDVNDGGLIYIEVPCFNWILEHHAWFDVFYEHVNYFRMQDFQRMFGRILAGGPLFGGQYLYVVADLASLRDPADATLGTPPPVTLPSGFFASLDRCLALAAPDSRRGVWGAAAKGVTFLHHLQPRGLDAVLAIDINPAKQGRFLAGSGVPVVAPAEGMRALGEMPDIFVMNSNYLTEIRAAGGPGARYLAVDKS